MYYNPQTNNQSDPAVHDVKGCTHIDDMPKSSKEFFARPARPGFKWDCLNGKWPEEVPIKPAPAANRRQSACAAIDHAAGNARGHFATSSAFIESEYQRAYDTATAWINSGYQGEAPRPVKSDAEAYKRTEQEAAQFIKETGGRWFKALDDIRDLRLKGKQAVKAGPDAADFMAIAQPFIDQLEGLWPKG